MPAPQRRTAPAPRILYLGTVEKVTGATASVIVPELGGAGFTYDAVRFPDYLKAGANTGTGSAPGTDGAPPHVHLATAPLAKGDSVLVGLLTTSTANRDTVVILSRLA